LIEQHKAQVEIYQREAGLRQSIALQSIGLEISLEEIYRDVAFVREE
jgi:hypothetical protein